jgi:dipeptidyl-peptidase 4
MKSRSLISMTLAAGLVLVVPLAGQSMLTRDDYARAERLLPWNFNKLVFKTIVVPQYIGKTDRFWYRNETRDGVEFILVDPALNTRQPAFDHVRLAAALSTASGKAYDSRKLPFEAIEFVKEGTAIQFDVEKTRWTCDLQTYVLAKSEAPKPAAPGESLSPDGRWAAFVKDHNLFVRPTAGGADVQLTTDGLPNYDYATETEQSTSAVTVRLSGMKTPPLLLWSPDSRKVLTHRIDQRKVEPLYLLQTVPPQGFGRPLLHEYRYVLPGDKNLPLAEMLIVDVEQKKSIPFKSQPFLLNFMSPFSLHQAWWSEDSRNAYFIEEERGCKSVRLRSADAASGETRLLAEEKGPTYVELNLTMAMRPSVRILSHGTEFIWFSERDGWGHLYLYDGKTGALKNQITRGPWIVRDIISVDETGRWVYFIGAGREKGRDPYYQHLYRAKLDGSLTQLLTPEDAEHSFWIPPTSALEALKSTFSPSGRYFVDTFSRADLAPASVLRDAEGRLVRDLEKADVDLLLATGWKVPERFSAKARDGITDIYGLIYKPTSFDPAKTYPVIDGDYPGPQAIRTPKSFGGLYASMDSSLAELGFIVVNIDGLGTPYRSKAFHDFSYGKLEDAGGLEDHITGLRQLASSRLYMDLGRVGIWGGSGGGFASTHAILAYPDFYKVAVSAAGNHDQRGYLAGWGERYQGLPQGDNYKAQANAGLAANLKGKLFLVHGDMDDNVHPSLTMQVVDALIKANKDFDLLILPNRNHGFYLEPYFIRRMWDYFVRNLMGAEPPRGYEIKPGKVN